MYEVRNVEKGREERVKREPKDILKPVRLRSSTDEKRNIYKTSRRVGGQKKKRNAPAKYHSHICAYIIYILSPPRSIKSRLYAHPTLLSDRRLVVFLHIRTCRCHVQRFACQMMV